MLLSLLQLQEKAMSLASKVYEQAAKERQSEEKDDKEDTSKKDDDVKEADALCKRYLNRWKSS